MRLRHLALAALVTAALGLSGCSAVLSATQGTMEGQQDAAADASAKAAISAAKIAVVAYGVENPGSLPSLDELAPYGYAPTDGVSGMSISGSADDFCVQATSSSGAVFHATLAGSIEDGACA